MWKKNGQETSSLLMDGRVLVGPKDAGEVMGCCARTFKRRLEEGRYAGVRCVRTLRGRLFPLVDIFRLAFPEATDAIIYDLVAQHIDRKMQERKQKNHKPQPADEEA